MSELIKRKLEPKEQASRDIIASGQRCYINIEKKVLTYCDNASNALWLNRLLL